MVYLSSCYFGVDKRFKIYDSIKMMLVVARWLKRGFLFSGVLALLSFFFLLPMFTFALAAEFNVGPGDVSGLISAINSANSSSGSDIINLSSGSTYSLTETNSNIGHENNGLPVVFDDITINGNGATLLRDVVASPFRIFASHVFTV